MTIRALEKTIHYYIAPNGKSPVLEWLKNIRDSGLLELRLDFGGGYRIYFTEQGAHIVILLCAGDKSTQSKDIKTAKAYLQALKEDVI